MPWQQTNAARIWYLICVHVGSET